MKIFNIFKPFVIWWHWVTAKDLSRDGGGLGPTFGIDADIEMEALIIFAGKKHVLECFLDLTDNGYITTPWNPLQDPETWGILEKPPRGELQKVAVIRIFDERGYIERVTDLGVTDLGVTNYSVIASTKAMEIRNAYDRIPPKLKEKLQDTDTKNNDK